MWFGIEYFLLWFPIVSGLSVLFHKENDNEVTTFELPVYLKGEASVKFKNYTFTKTSVQNLNISLDELSRGIVEGDGRKNSETYISPRGIRIALKKTVFTTLEEMKDDPTLAPLPLKKLKWSKPESCDFLKTFRIFINSTFVSGWINSVQVECPNHKDLVQQMLWQEAGMVESNLTEADNEGLILVATNLTSCRVTFQEIFPMRQFGIYRSLNWMMDSFALGTFVMILSLFDGSVLLDETSREKFLRFGSSWSKNYYFRDCWLWAFTKGGTTKLDILVPNLGSVNSSGSPFEVSFPIVETEEVQGCSTWRKDEEFEARKLFCVNHEGFGKLCDCEDPLYFPPSGNRTVSHENDIPIAILTGGRPRLLTRLLETLYGQRGIKRDFLVIAMDGYNEGVAKIGFILGIKVLYHGVEGSGGTRISRLLRFSLFNQLRLFPKNKFFINLEDDLVVAKDFYSFMLETSVAFSIDPTIWCVSAFNLLSYPHTSRNATRLYRGYRVPSYGWMMPSHIIEELLVHWLPADKYHEWDFFLADPKVNLGRECIFPEVIRSKHPDGGGIHFPNSLFVERHHAVKQLNTKEIRIDHLERLRKDYYEREVNELIGNSTVINATTCDDIGNSVDGNGIMIGKSGFQGNMYTIYLNKTSSALKDALRVIHKTLGMHTKDNHMTVIDVERFHYYNSTIFVALVPSSFSLNWSSKYTTFAATEEDLKKIYQEEEQIRKKLLEPKTHFRGSELPSF